jgi:hypothetical protein
MEFLNVGVVLAVPEAEFIGVRFAESHGRIDRFFQHSQSSFLQHAKQGLARRLALEFSKGFQIEALESFAAKRANELRVSPFLPIAVDEPQIALDRLFYELVGEDKVHNRRPRMARVLKEAFVKASIFGLVEEKPDPVELPELGISIKAPFGYQNGAYNLIDGMQFSADPGEALEKAGKRALEGALLWKQSQRDGPQKRLVVVGDFSGKPNSFYDAVGEQLEKSHVRLYRLDHIGPLVEDITQNASLHSN